MKKTVMFERKTTITYPDDRQLTTHDLVFFVVDTEIKKAYYARHDKDCVKFDFKFEKVNKELPNYRYEFVKIIKTFDKEIFWKEQKKSVNEYLNEQLSKICKTDNAMIKGFFSRKWDFQETMNLPKVIKTLNNFKELNKSPYSDSFYNSKDIDWNYKPEGSLRLSDHWNFWSQGKTHCEVEGTDGELIENCWMLCQFKNGKYHIIERF